MIPEENPGEKFKTSLISTNKPSLKLVKSTSIGRSSKLILTSSKSPEEVKVLEFIESDPKIVLYRNKRLQKLDNDLSHLKVIKSETVINENGILAKCITTEDG